MKKYLFSKTFILMLVLLASVFVLFPQQSSADWTEQTGSGSRFWTSIASSSDGTKLAAVDGNAGYIYTYTPIE